MASSNDSQGQPPHVTVDNVSVVLLSLIIVVSLVHMLGSRAQPLLHPILLGRQADFARVRRKGESPVIRNPAAAIGSLPRRPHHTIQTAADLLNGAKGSLADLTEPSGRRDDSTSLAAQILSARKALLAGAPGQEEDEGDAPRIAIVLADSRASLVYALAAATFPHPVLRLPFSGNAGSLPSAFQTVLRSHASSLALIITEKSLRPAVQDCLQARSNPTIVDVQDLQRGSLGTEKSGIPQAAWKSTGFAVDDCDRQILREVSSVAIGSSAGSVAAFTSTNLTAATVAFLSLFSPLAKLEPTDRVAIQARGLPFSLTSVGAVASSLNGSAVGLFDDLNVVATWNPSVLVLDGALAIRLAREASEIAGDGFLASRGVAAREAKLSEGALCEKIPGVERFVGSKLRAIIVSGSLTEATAVALRAHFAATVQHVLTHPHALGPLFASQAFDFQTLSPNPEHAQAHFGPPVATVEAKIVRQQEPAGSIVKGGLAVSGPSVASHVTTEELRSEGWPYGNGWVDVTSGTGEEAHLLPNGTIRLATA